MFFKFTMLELLKPLTLIWRHAQHKSLHNTVEHKGS